MLESAVTKKGQTTLPKLVRETLGVQAGDRVRYFIVDGSVRILPVRPIGRLFGALPYSGPPVTVEQMRQAAADEAVEGTRASGADAAMGAMLSTAADEAGRR